MRTESFAWDDSRDFRVRILAGRFTGRLGTARPAFSRGSYHVALDGAAFEMRFEEHEIERVAA